MKNLLVFAPFISRTNRKFRAPRAGSWKFLGGVCCSLLVSAAAIAEPVGQWDFEQDTTEWVSWNKSEGKTGADAGQFISHSNDEGAGETKGCLQIQIPAELSEGIHPILLGAAAKIPKILGSEDAPARVRIVLSAKTKGSDGPVFLRIGRAGGGGEFSKIELSSDWQQYEAELSSPLPLHTLLFTPTDKEGVRISESPVLIDQVKVDEVLE